MEEILIELVRRHRCLWHPADPRYFDRPFKERVWVEIAQELPGPSGSTMSPELVRRKWKALKDARAANRRRLKGRSGQANLNSRIYKYSAVMSFLDGIDEETENAVTATNLTFQMPSQDDSLHQQHSHNTDETELDGEVVLEGDTQQLFEHMYDSIVSPATSPPLRPPVTSATSRLAVTSATSRLAVTSATSRLAVTSATSRLAVTSATSPPVTSATSRLAVTSATSPPVTSATSRLAVTSATSPPLRAPVTSATSRSAVTSATPQPLSQSNSAILEDLRVRQPLSRAGQRNLTQQRRAGIRQNIIDDHRNAQTRAPAEASSQADEPARQPAAAAANRLPARRRADAEAVTEALLRELQRNPDDDHTQFCLSLVPLMRRIPINAVINIRIQILQILREQEYEEL